MGAASNQKNTVIPAIRLYHVTSALEKVINRRLQLSEIPRPKAPVGSHGSF